MKSQYKNSGRGIKCFWLKKTAIAALSVLKSEREQTYQEIVETLILSETARHFQAKARAAVA